MRRSLLASGLVRVSAAQNSEAVNDVQHRVLTTTRSSLPPTLAALVAVAGLALAACTSQATSPQTSASVTPTVSAQFVSPSALSGSASPSSESAAVPMVSTSSVRSASPESPTASTPVGATPQSSTPLGSVLPEVVNPTDPQEIADRQAVEAAWVRFWDYWPTFEELSPQERESIGDNVAVDPLKAQMLDGASNADAGGRTGYGTVAHRISWFQSVDGQNSIVIADCMDQSLMGSSDRATGKKLSRGYDRTPIRGDLVKSDDGTWKVRNLYYLLDEQC